MPFCTWAAHPVSPARLSSFRMLRHPLRSVEAMAIQIFSQGNSYLTLSTDAVPVWHWAQPPASSVPPLHKPQLPGRFCQQTPAPCLCSTICDIWGAVVLWLQLCNNEHILQLSSGHGSCNYRAAQEFLVHPLLQYRSIQTYELTNFVAVNTGGLLRIWTLVYKTGILS